MVQILLYILLVLCLFVFINDLKELHKKDIEYLKSIGREEIKQYIEKTFGNENYKIFKSFLDAEGKLRHTIYLSHSEWFKTPEHKWYDIYATNNGYCHELMEE